MPAIDSLADKIHHLAQITQRPVTLKQLFEFGRERSPQRLLTAAQFLHQELPVRLSHRVKDLESLPFGLSGMPAVQAVKGMYTESIGELIELYFETVSPDAFINEVSRTGAGDGWIELFNPSTEAADLTRERRAIGTVDSTCGRTYHRSVSSRSPGQEDSTNE